MEAGFDYYNNQLIFFFYSIHPSAHDNSIVQIPIGNNTGSLPDLTSVHFPSPLHTPIDQEHDHSSSPYSSVSGDGWNDGKCEYSK